MRAQLERLVELQKIHDRMAEVDKQRGILAARLEQIRSQLIEEESELSRLRDELAATQQERRQRESQHRLDQEKVKRWEQRAREVRNTREYQALLREIEAAKFENSELETEILRLMERVDELGSEAAAQESKVLTLRREAEDVVRQGGVHDGEVADQLKELAAKRQAIAEQLDIRHLKAFERSLSYHRDGSAVCYAVDATCQGCHMGIRPQLFNIILGMTTIESCPSCLRLLIPSTLMEQDKEQTDGDADDDADDDADEAADEYDTDSNAA